MKTTNYTKKITLAGIAAICAATAGLAVHADEVTAPALTVRYADLNLNTAAGAAVLYRRIKNAAEQVCGDVNTRRLEEAAAARACVARAIEGSVHAVNNVQLTREYNAHAGVQNPMNVASLR